MKAVLRSGATEIGENVDAIHAELEDVQREIALLPTTNRPMQQGHRRSGR